MLNSIKIKNFQSHKQTNIEFSPGITSIIGSSDSGKSAILRALYWVVYNRPAGDSIISHWNKTDDKIKGDTFVEITKADKTVKRIKSNTENSYWLDENEFKNVKMDVPPEISTEFNISDVNIQRQMDSPFLISQTGGEVAKYFNSLIKLDCIDNALLLIDRKRKQNKAEIEQNQNAIKTLTEKQKEFNWIEAADRTVKRLELLNEKITNLQHRNNDLNKTINTYQAYQAGIDTANKLITLEPSIKKIESVIEQINDKIKQITTLKSVINEYNLLTEKINKYDQLISLSVKVDRITTLISKIQEKTKRITDLTTSILTYTESKAKTENKLIQLEPKITKIDTLIQEISAKTIKIKELKSQIDRHGIHNNTIQESLKMIDAFTAKLPKTCPTCGMEIRSDI